MNFKKDSVNPIMLLIENLGEISILADEVVDNPDVISDNQEREILTDIYGKFMKKARYDEEYQKYHPRRQGSGSIF